MGTHPIFESDFDCLTDCMEVGETRDLGRPPGNIPNGSNRRGNYQGIRGRGRGRGGRGGQSNNRGGNNNRGNRYEENGQSYEQQLQANQNGGNGEPRRFYNHGNRPPPKTRNRRTETTNQNGSD